MLFAVRLPGWPLLYRYTAVAEILAEKLLLCQNFCHPPSNHCTDVLLPVQTLLRVEAWEKALRRHPNTAFVRYVISGLRNGFRIGFNHSSPLCSAAKNMEPAHQHPEIILDYLTKEQSLGCMLGPFTAHQQVWCNSKRAQHGNMALNHRPFLFTWTECQ